MTDAENVVPVRLLLLVRLHKDRRQVGSLSLIEIEDGGERADARVSVNDLPAGFAAGKVAFSCDASGKSDQASADKAKNLHRDPRQPFGDTPTGRWAGCRVAVRPHARENDGIGARWIELPWECAADDETRRLLDPKIKGSRSKLGIHGGRGNGNLMATKGCVRLRDQDFARLDQLIAGRRFDVAIVDAEVDSGL